MLELILHRTVKPTFKTEGVWQLARLTLDKATNEQLNVGVVFTDHNDGRVTSKFLRNMSGLRCLYNDDMANDAAFLIDQAEQALEQGMQQLPAGWNISLSPSSFVRGHSAKSIVDNLYQRLVPLGQRETAQERLDTDDHTHTTRNVRKTVRDLLRGHLRISKNPEFWRSAAVTSMQEGAQVQMDLQIFGSGKTGDFRGSIASAWYKTQYHRSAYLNSTANTVLTAQRIYPMATNVMYLLQPLEIEGFTKAEMGVIEQEVQSAAWLLRKSGANLVPFTTERAMAQRILEDMAAIQPLAQ